MWFDIDYDRLVVETQLKGLRKIRVSAFAKALVRPIRTLHNKWKVKRNRNLYILAHNVQVCYMRGALNDMFDPDLRRIYIDGGINDREPTYIYTPAEMRPKYLGTIYSYNSMVNEGTGFDFIVYVPTAIMATQSFEMNAQINLYRLGGKRYSIELI